MGDPARKRRDGSPAAPSPLIHRRTTSTSSSSPGPGLLSKLPFMRTSTGSRSQQDGLCGEASTVTAPAPARSLAAAVQQQKTRRRRGSLRKAALLGRGAQRDRRDSKPSSIGSVYQSATVATEAARPTSTSASDDAIGAESGSDALGFIVPDTLPRTTTAGFTSRAALTRFAVPLGDTTSLPDPEADGFNAYISTTDEEDMLQIPHGPAPSRSGLSMSPVSDSYFTNREPMQRRASFQQAKSPLSYSGLSTTASPAPDSDWDYSETEWWGWVLLCVTWFVFVIGMGSCFDVWSWTWDVGTTPYAPPEFEDDPTLPLVGYYPALIILTGVMAWVWVFVAWTGMKYFRHAKISGD